MAATEEQLAKLAPYIAGAKPDPRGEIDMYCPLHNDTRRSASLNVEMGAWYCHAGCGGSSVAQLLDAEDTWVSAEGRTRVVASSNGFTDPSQPGRSEVRRWARRLVRDRRALHGLWELRGITPRTARRARLGWDGRFYKIPVFSPEREVWNVRTYDPAPKNGRRKIWGVRGMNRARLYPIRTFYKANPGDAIVFCEGEWDTLLALQAGYFAVTRTDGAGKPWKKEWTPYFAGKRIFLCHDRDRAGLKSDRITMEALSGCAEVRRIVLPYEVEEKNGKDLTDYLLDQDDQSLALGRLMSEATTELEEYL